ncbi:MAG TPA: [protein-PII] uridylyltransferase [Kiloniellaceae bacterium]|nr:[protein-PII] uridylyltransferase [Kiloniellaceae bacterium]
MIGRSDIDRDTLMTRDREVPDPLGIIDRHRVQAEVQAVAEGDLSSEAARAAVLEIVRTALTAGRAEVSRRFANGATGRDAAFALCHLSDQLIRILYDYVSTYRYPSANLSTGELLSLVAIGGYGRGELAPYSDIDLLFLMPYKLMARSEQVVEEVLYFLWDLGLKVGHATRSINDCVRLSKQDHVICTSLLEARWIAGDRELFVDFRRSFRQNVQGGGLQNGTRASREAIKFIEAKLQEREQRHRRLGDSRYSLEPHIKDGKGGLRDLQSLFWIAKFIYNVDDIRSLIEPGVFTAAEVRRFAKAENFLWTLRFHLHDLCSRGEERLTFDMQIAIAPRLGYTAHAGARDVERFMKHYFLVAKDVGDLTRIFCAWLETRHRRRPRFRLSALRQRRRVGGFAVDGDRLTVKSEVRFKDKPVEMLRIFQVAQEHELDIHPQALRWITRNRKHIDKSVREDRAANEIFLAILTSPKDPETALRRLNEAGVLGRFLPDFGRVVAQMQYNMYHHYTVDEHTIFAIGILNAIERGLLKDEAPIASDVVQTVVSRRVLYLALLFHDVAKGRAGDHSEVGARIVRKLCPRLGLSEAETETVAWLVRYHLSMSDTAFKRDVNDPKTSENFAKLVQSPERLRLLLVLTVADIRAVGPHVWNAWKAALLRELYWRTEELLSGGLETAEVAARASRIKELLSARLEDWSKKDREAHLRRGSTRYWISADLETLARQAELVRSAEKSKAPLSVDLRIDRYRQATEVTVYTADMPGLFSRLAGAIAVAGASIVAARIVTLKNGMALDSFFVEDVAGGLFDRRERRQRLVACMEQSLFGKLSPLQELQRRTTNIPSRYRVFKVPPQVLVDNNASADHTVVEVNGRDRPGLLYQITQALHQLKLTIRSARIATYGEHAVDVFYLQDAGGKKIESPRRIKTIEAKVLASLNDDPTAGPAAPVKAPAKKPVKRTVKPAAKETVTPKRPRQAAKRPSGSRAAAEAPAARRRRKA